MSNARINQLKKQLQEYRLDSFLVTSPTNIYYLSGFTGDEGLLLVTENETYLISDQRFEIELNEQKNAIPVITRNYLESACEILKKENLVALGFEESISYQMYDQLDELSPADIVPTENVIESLRAIKSSTEIQKIQQAIQIAQLGFEFFLDHLNQGLSERQLANQLDYFMKTKDATKASFDTIIASGQNTLAPHSTVSKRKIQVNELVLLDFGYYYQNYTFDITRTVYVGKASSKVRELYQIVLEALNETTEILKPGLQIAQIYQQTINVFKKYQLEQYFTHGIGHGIGLSIHELPALGSQSDEQLKSGEVITIEPGLYVPEIGGIRIENDILITNDGFKNLSGFATKFIEI